MPPTGTKYDACLCPSVLATTIRCPLLVEYCSYGTLVFLACLSHTGPESVDSVFYFIKKKQFIFQLLQSPDQKSTLVVDSTNISARQEM